MKYLLLLFILIGCSKDDLCKSLDSVVGLAAGALSVEFDCNSSKVLSDLQKAASKIPYCQDKGVQVAGLNSEELKCSMVPMLVKFLGDEASKEWECKKVGMKLEDMLKQALKCQ